MRCRLRGAVLVVVAAAAASMLAACSRKLECSDESVQNALEQALDNRYAQSRQLAQVDVTLNDIVAVQEAPRGASCKVLVHLHIEYLGQIRENDATIPYTAELTDKGNVLVTLQK